MAEQKKKQRAKKKAADDSGGAEKTDKNAPPKPKYHPIPSPDRRFDKAAVDKALEALTTYDWGADQDAVQPIDDAVQAAHGDAAARQELEARLAEVLPTALPRPAKCFVCRMLGEIGTAASVPALAALLTDKDLSHPARSALARIDGPDPLAALREALTKVSGPLKAGMIQSLGARRDPASVEVLADLVADSDSAVALAAINALGKIVPPQRAKDFAATVQKAPDNLKPVAADAVLTCAERLVAEGHKTEAIALYKDLSAEEQPKHVRTAAARGLLATLQK